MYSGFLKLTHPSTPTKFDSVSKSDILNPATPRAEAGLFRTTVFSEVVTKVLNASCA